MSSESLAVEILKLANDDLVFSDNLYDLTKYYNYFSTPSFAFWCDIAEITEESRILIKKGVRKRYEILKFVLENCDGKNYYMKDGYIVINTCIRRALFKFEDILYYFEAFSINFKPCLRIKF